MSMDFGYTNSTTSPVTPARVLSPEPLNFGADFRVLKDTGSEVILTRINSDLSDPETIRYSFSEIADIFKGSSVEPPSGAGVIGQTIKGCSVLVQLNTTGGDALSGITFPISAHLVLKVPYGPDTNANNIQQVLQRLLGALYDTGTEVFDSRISALLRGAVTPKDL